MSKHSWNRPVRKKILVGADSETEPPGEQFSDEAPTEVEKPTRDDAATDDPTITAALTDTEDVTDDDPVDDDTAADAEPAPPITRRRTAKIWSILAFGVFPSLAMVLALGAGFLKWENHQIQDTAAAARESTQAAKESTIALLSYKPDTVEQQLNAARDRLTGEFRESYTQLINDVVVPGAIQQLISADAQVPAAASVSSNARHAVVLVFVNQTVTVGKSVPTARASAVRVTLDKIDDRWLISQFDPV